MKTGLRNNLSKQLFHILGLYRWVYELVSYIHDDGVQLTSLQKIHFYKAKTTNSR